jgi:phospholipid/cholesterol/gamma-HCH transport system permease protein
LLDFLKPPVEAFQDFTLLSARAVSNIFRGPHYSDDIFQQMDIIGVGSLPICSMVGLFSGIVMALQLGDALTKYGAESQVGTVVSITLVTQMGPVLAALLVAGRNASGMASEIGSMRVTEQIDAMRALGTDPSKKLVTPRLLATAVTLPLLVIIADFIGLIGGYLIASAQMGLTYSEYWTSAWQALKWADVSQGLLKPLIFGIIIALVGCSFGMRTTGGTQGVGRATTSAVVVSSLWIIILNALITQIFVKL